MGHAELKKMYGTSYVWGSLRHRLAKFPGKGQNMGQGARQKIIMSHL